MKYHVFGSIFGWCCLCLTSACQHQVPENRSWKTFHAEYSKPLSMETDAPSANICIEMDYLIAQDSVCLATNRNVMSLMYGQANHNDVKTVADSFATDYLNRYQKELQSLYHKEKQTNVSRAWYAYERHIKAKNISKYASLIQYQIEQYYHEGGSMEYQETIFLNFDAESGARLSLDSIFKKGTKIDLESLLLQQLEKSQNVSSLEELRNQGFLKLTSMYATENFLLEDHGIRFFYQPNELSSYENGATSVFLPYKLCKNILTDKIKDLWN